MYFTCVFVFNPSLSKGIINFFLFCSIENDFLNRKASALKFYTYFNNGEFEFYSQKEVI